MKHNIFRIMINKHQLVSRLWHTSPSSSSPVFSPEAACLSRSKLSGLSQHSTPPLSNSLNSHNAPVRKPHIPFCSVEMQENTHRHTHTLKSPPYSLWHHVCVRYVLTRSLATAQSLQLRNKLQHMDLYIHVCLRAALCMCKRVCVCENFANQNLQPESPPLK